MKSKETKVQQPTAFTMSQVEVRRRQSAFTVMLFFLLLGFVFTGVLYLRFYGLAFAVCAILATGFSVISWFGIRRFFKRFVETRFLVHKDCLERQSQSVSEKYFWREVKKIKLKRTTRGAIREIELVGASTFVNGLDDFEEFGRELAKRCPKALWQERREHLDYDHPLFYVIFGTIAGIILGLAVKLMLEAADETVMIWITVIATFVSLLGIYFVLAKPLVSRYGKKSRLSDYSIGAALVLSATAVFLLGIK